VISLEAVTYSSYCNMVEWFWWDLSLSQLPTGFLQFGFLLDCEKVKVKVKVMVIHLI